MLGTGCAAHLTIQVEAFTDIFPYSSAQTGTILEGRPENNRTLNLATPNTCSTAASTSCCLPTTAHTRIHPRPIMSPSRRHAGASMPRQRPWPIRVLDRDIAGSPPSQTTALEERKICCCICKARARDKIQLLGYKHCQIGFEDARTPREVGKDRECGRGRECDDRRGWRCR